MRSVLVVVALSPLVAAAVLLSAVAASSAGPGGYRLASRTGDCNSTSGCTGSLAALGDDGLYGKPIPRLKLQAMVETASRLHVKLTDADSSRWEPPGILRQPETEWRQEAARVAAPPHLLALQIPTPGEDFRLAVTRTGPSNSDLFNCSSSGLAFKDRYLQIGTSLSRGDVIMGIGQHSRSTLGVQPGTYTLWNHDEGQGANMYGSHPFYMVLRADGTSHGVFLLNSNAMDIVVTEESLTFRVVGGVLDLYIFAGPSPKEVVRQYHNLIGFPVLPPYWGLAFHQCRWGYVSTEHTRSVVAGYVAASIPLDVIWNDIDSLGSCESAGPAHGGASNCDFTWGQNFTTQGDLIEELHGDGPLGGRRYVVIFDPAIGNVTGYQPYEDGKAADVFIKQGDGSGDNFVGKLWPGSVVWPSFINPRAKAYWAKQVADFHKHSKFDGMWLDENEISNMELEHAPISDGRPAWSQPCATARYCDLPYTVNNTGRMANLSFGTIAADAIHGKLNGSSHGELLREFDVHNLYGALETQASAEAMRTITGKRAFVISRSSFPGISGRSGGHWLGDAAPDWATVETTVPGVMTMGIFGAKNGIFF
jgi:alpha-glucosidase